MNILQKLYDSEINFSINSFWDGGFCVQLGDDLNGFVAETILHEWDKVEPWLLVNAVRHYPESDFVKNYRLGDE